MNLFHYLIFLHQIAVLFDLILLISFLYYLFDDAKVNKYLPLGKFKTNNFESTPKSNFIFLGSRIKSIQWLLLRTILQEKVRDESQNICRDGRCSLLQYPDGSKIFPDIVIDCPLDFIALKDILLKTLSMSEPPSG